MTSSRLKIHFKYHGLVSATVYHDTVLSLVAFTRVLLLEVFVCVSVEKSPESA